MGENPSEFEGNYRPVERVSYDDICEGNNGFLAKLDTKLKIEYPDLIGMFILPSEAQWEFAARGGQYWNKPKLTYAGSENLNDVGWYEDNSNNQTMPVGLKQPNALGLYDMSGNIHEWCADQYMGDYLKIPDDGSPFSEHSNYRVLRGGNYSGLADFCRIFGRHGRYPNQRFNFIGFRLVFTG